MRLLLVAGEASADLHAAHLVERLRAAGPVELCGIGGDRLAALGLNPLQHARDLAVVGLTEALKKIPQTLRLLGELETLAARERPAAALLLDLPDFNLRLAPRLKRLGIPVIYYISPQVWAWRPGRVQAMTTSIDLLLSILPFEPAWYAKNAPAGLRLQYVGHPVLEEIPELPFQPEERQLALLPGSRESEWRKLFAPMLGAAAEMAAADPSLRFVLPVAEPMRGNPYVAEALRSDGPQAELLQALGSRFRALSSPAHELLRRSRAAWIASGTATLEAAIVGIPMVVAYKVSGPTAFLFRHLIRYQGPVAMANIIHCGLGSPDRLVPELLQGEVTAPRLAAAMRGLLAEPRWSATRETLSRTRALLSGPGLPLDNAASAIRAFLAEAR